MNIAMPSVVSARIRRIATRSPDPRRRRDRRGEDGKRSGNCARLEEALAAIGHHAGEQPQMMTAPQVMTMLSAVIPKTTGGVPLVVAAEVPVIRLHGTSLPGWWTIHHDWSDT